MTRVDRTVIHAQSEWEGPGYEVSPLPYFSDFVRPESECLVPEALRLVNGRDLVHPEGELL